jgi:hypothetical protein
MKSRRNFIQNGSFAAIALLAAKPFTTLANKTTPSIGSALSNNQINFLHSTNFTVLQQAGKLKKASSAIFLNPAKSNSSKGFSTGVDVEMSVIENEDYKIVYKDSIKVGIITADAEENLVAEKVNYLSNYLKTTKACDVVVCLSTLGFKIENKLDDITLAEKSTHLDVIISGHENNFCQRPYIALNSKKEEVIINHNASNMNDVGKISIGFDKRTGKKNHIEFIRK